MEDIYILIVLQSMLYIYCLLSLWKTLTFHDIRMELNQPLSLSPGSHDSFSYSLSPSGEIGPDAPQVVTSLSRVCPALVRPTLLRWSVTQKATVTEQLKHGVRLEWFIVSALQSQLKLLKENAKLII